MSLGGRRGHLRGRGRFRWAGARRRRRCMRPAASRGTSDGLGSPWRHVAKINGIVAATAIEDADTIFTATNGDIGIVCGIAANDIATARADDVLDRGVRLTTSRRGAPGQQSEVSLL